MWSAGRSGKGWSVGFGKDGPVDVSKDHGWIGRRRR
jgi:hypothetical protein